MLRTGAQARGSEGVEGVHVDYPPAELAKGYEFGYGAALFGRLIARR